LYTVAELAAISSLQQRNHAASQTAFEAARGDAENEKAVVKQGTNESFQTTPPITTRFRFTFLAALLKLEVTPQITGRGTYL